MVNFQVPKNPDDERLEDISLSDMTPGMSGSPPNITRPTRKKTAEDYFQGPRDPNHHSKWPFFFRIHGSIMPEMILPMSLVGLWATLVTVIIRAKFPQHNFDPILLTVLGFLVGLTLSFRQSTAYERYMEGRRAWGSLMTQSENLARNIWLHVREREGEQGKEDLLAKLSALNLIVSFSVALKHKLQFQPYVDYPDLRGYISHLSTHARDANEIADLEEKPLPMWKKIGNFLNVTFASDNPRAPLKNAKRPLGNLPLEILCYLQSYLDSVIDNKTLTVPAVQMQAVITIQNFNDVVNVCERILNTPLPVAYSIAIAHITWLYIIILPFQLYKRLGWNTIPGTLVAGYVILGLAEIASQIENPFGDDVNDLPMDSFCTQIAHNIDVITSRPRPDPGEFIRHEANLPLYPLSTSSYESWINRSAEEIREALGMKIQARFKADVDTEKPGMIRRKTEFPDV